MTIPDAPPPARVPALPAQSLPEKACDAHVHLLGDDFRLWDERVENPAPGNLDDWLSLYRMHLTTLGFSRGVVVHSILYGTDNSVTIEALRRLGPNFRGVGLVTDAATEPELDALVAAGIKAVRLNYVHGGVLSWEGAKALAPALAERGLHIEMLAHAHLHLEELAEDVRRIPVEIVFDHCAWPDLSNGIDTPGLNALAALLADGQAWAKLSALYRFAGDNVAAAEALVAKLAAANPERCLWGSDWPHIMLNGVPMPDAGDLLNGFLRTVDNQNLQQRIFVDNPARLYGF